MDNKQNKQDEHEKKKLVDLNNLFRKTISSISQNLYGSDTTKSEELERINTKIDEIITQELNDTKSITSDDMSTFLVKLFNDFDNKDNFDRKDINEIFTDDSSGLFQFFQQRYQNQNLLYEDLNMITTQLFELEEAVLTTRDAIITADDISQTISRTLKFTSIDADDNEYNTYIRTVEALERKLNLPTKIKNMIVPNTLTYGSYYVYVCPYSKLFEQQYKNKLSDVTMRDSLKESITESFISNFKNDPIIKKSVSSSAQELKKTMESYADGIKVYNDIYSIPLIEGVDLTSLLDDKTFNKTRDDAIKKADKIATSYDGLVDVDKKIDGMFDEQSGCYIKYIEPKKMIPVKILDTVIGYYYIHDVDFQVNKSPFSTSIKVTNINQQTNEDVETMFLSKITDRIVSAFDKKFLENNVKFKDMILNALLYNDMYKKQITFQFIPRDYVVEFKVNEDVDGNGRSILTKTLFYAKLYLALLIFKMISIITRSNDTKVYYVKNSGMETNITNKIQEVARSVKGRQINFMDLLNYNSIISKIGAYKEIFIPVGRSGERGIEFDILSGQDVPLNTDLMEMLRTNMINGTGVPSVIMNYINEADYAKTLTMANSKFVGRVVSLQLDFNPALTDLYKKIMRFSNISIPDEAIEGFIYTLNPPKTLNTMNMTDMIGNADQVVMNAIKAKTGENADQTDDNNKIKDIMYNTLIREYLPMINWSMVDEAYENAKIELTRIKEEAKLKKDDESGDSSGY